MQDKATTQPPHIEVRLPARTPLSEAVQLHAELAEELRRAGLEAEVELVWAPDAQALRMALKR